MEGFMIKSTDLTHEDRCYLSSLGYRWASEDRIEYRNEEGAKFTHLPAYLLFDFDKICTYTQLLRHNLSYYKAFYKLITSLSEVGLSPVPTCLR